MSRYQSRNSAHRSSSESKEETPAAAPFQMPAGIREYYGLQSPASGDPLPAPTRQHMERSFRTDFSDVRVHTGSQAQSVGALAFARGSDLHFAPGAYDPSSRSGRELIGHELTHVVQQRSGLVGGAQGKNGSGPAINADPALEAEADRLGADAARGEVVTVSGAGAGVQPKMAPGAVIQCGGGGSKEEKKTDPTTSSDEEPAPPTQAEKEQAIGKTIEALKALACEAIRNDAANSHVKHWTNQNIVNNRLWEAMKILLAGENKEATTQIERRLVDSAVCANVGEAKAAILTRLQPAAPPAKEEDPSAKKLAWQNHQYKFGTRTFTGGAAFVAQAVKERNNSQIADSGLDWVQQAGSTLEADKLIPDLAPEALVKDDTFMSLALAKYLDLVQANSGAKGQGTQLGEHKGSTAYDTPQWKGALDNQQRT